MRTSLYFIFSLICLDSIGAELPSEVKSFISDRDLCDHFRGKDFEGNSERAIFVRKSLDIYCAGTDVRLAALKRRYKDKKNIFKLLDKYAEKIES